MSAFAYGAPSNGTVMRCEFCNQKLVGHPQVVSIPGQGLAHPHCYTTAQFNRRVFEGVDIAALDDERLSLLRELVVTEVNSRQRDRASGLGVELF